MSKHQQVQLLEAAAILVGMDSNSGSLPEEKALWPAAISPPSSGLLGSDKINYEKLRSMPRQTTEAERNDRAFSPMTNDGNGTERSMSVVTDSFGEDEEIDHEGRQRHYIDEEEEEIENEDDDDDDGNWVDPDSSMREDNDDEEEQDQLTNGHNPNESTQSLWSSDGSNQINEDGPNSSVNKATPAVQYSSNAFAARNKALGLLSLSSPDKRETIKGTSTAQGSEEATSPNSGAAKVPSDPFLAFVVDRTNKDEGSSSEDGGLQSLLSPGANATETSFAQRFQDSLNSSSDSHSDSNSNSESSTST